MPAKSGGRSRIGFAAGNAELIDALYGVRTNMGYGTPAAIQEGGAFALDHVRELARPVAKRYEQRRDFVVEGFRALGWEVDAPAATMFVWSPAPASR